MFKLRFVILGAVAALVLGGGTAFAKGAATNAGHADSHRDAVASAALTAAGATVSTEKEESKTVTKPKAPNTCTSGDPSEEKSEKTASGSENTSEKAAHSTKTQDRTEDKSERAADRTEDKAERAALKACEVANRPADSNVQD
jgi:hypothetical protein